MKQNAKCRVCGNKFFAKPLLEFKNMPRVAQFFPNAKTLEKDKGINFDVLQCSGCGLVQLNSEPVPYYKKTLRAAGVSEEMKNFRKKQFSKFVQKYSLKGKKVIEIGCGRGEYLSLIKQTGANAYGLEYSNKSVGRCVESGLKVSKGFIKNSDYKLNHGPFSAFFILNFIEHLPNPNSILRGIHNNLEDSAVGIVEVPNFDMILRNNLFSEFMTDHIFYFTKDTLNTMLNLNGFEIVNCDEIWHDYIISAVVRKKKGLELPHFLKCQNQIKKQIEKYIDSYKNKKVAIWGAGHQALAIISLMNLNNKIKYVIDSAPEKQNRFTPATHIKIVSPGAINSDPPDAIIVMAASYSDEVVKIIRRKFDRNIDVSILKISGLEKI